MLIAVFITEMVILHKYVYLLLLLLTEEDQIRTFVVVEILSPLADSNEADQYFL